VRKSSKDGEEIRLVAADPLNLLGIVLPGPRLSALSGEDLRLRDGVPFDPSEATAHASAFVSISRISI
jgi:ATP-dependent Lhr-like helicase